MDIFGIVTKQNLTGTTIVVISTSNLEHNLVRHMTFLFFRFFNSFTSAIIYYVSSLKRDQPWVVFRNYSNAVSSIDKQVFCSQLLYSSNGDTNMKIRVKF